MKNTTVSTLDEKKSKQELLDKVRASRAGHNFHERWTARRALQLVFPQDGLSAISVEGLSTEETIPLSKETDEVADLTLYYGGDTFETSKHQKMMQFKYKVSGEPITASYLKKTLTKFAKSYLDFSKDLDESDVSKRLSFGFVVNSEMSDDLHSAITYLRNHTGPLSTKAPAQVKTLVEYCDKAGVAANILLSLIDFQAGTEDLPSQTRAIRRTISDWSSGTSGLTSRRILNVVELVRNKAELPGTKDNLITREDILEALDCDEDELFPAVSQFITVENITDRDLIVQLGEKLAHMSTPVFLHAEGGVGKTVLVQSLVKSLEQDFEIVLFDCFGGGSYRSELQHRHSPRVALVQIINELAARGLCDPLLPTDGDYKKIIKVARKRLEQVSQTIAAQSKKTGALIVIDASDNAQLEADARGEKSFARLLLASLSEKPIPGVKLLLTARPERMRKVIGKSDVERIKLLPFNKTETRNYLCSRIKDATGLEIEKAFARSGGNARILKFLVETWDENIREFAEDGPITVNQLIADKCKSLQIHLSVNGWQDEEVDQLFAALSLLPPPVPLTELAAALDWSAEQITSVVSDLAPLLENLPLGTTFRDEPTETYFRQTFGNQRDAQVAIAGRMRDRQTDSIYAAEILPHFFKITGNFEGCFELAQSDDYPKSIKTQYGRRRLKLKRLEAAFALAVRAKDKERILDLSLKLSLLASANAKGDEFIRGAPSLAIALGDRDVARRLFDDRSGWRGERHSRLMISAAFRRDMIDARLHRERGIRWYNWFQKNKSEEQQFRNDGPSVFDLSAIFFVSLLEGDFDTLNRNLPRWRSAYSLEIIRNVVQLCAEHQQVCGSNILSELVKFAASRKCKILEVRLGLLSNNYGLSADQIKIIARAISGQIASASIELEDQDYDHKNTLSNTLSKASLAALGHSSKQSASRIIKLLPTVAPLSHDYDNHYHTRDIWSKVRNVCAQLWANGKPLSYHALIPGDISPKPAPRMIRTEADFKAFLKKLRKPENAHSRNRGARPTQQARFEAHQIQWICSGINTVLSMIRPLERIVLARQPVSSEFISDYLRHFEDALEKQAKSFDRSRSANATNQIGFGVLFQALSLCETLEEQVAKQLIALFSQGRFFLNDKLTLLNRLSKHSNLGEALGAFSKEIVEDIIKDEDIASRGGSFKALAREWLFVSQDEAKHFFAEGISQLDQMGGEDYDFIYDLLRFAGAQHGGEVKPKLGHRLMNLAQTIFYDEPHKFGWRLFSEAAAKSIGYQAIYKAVRWDDQDVANYSYALPQLACFLTREGKLDPKRAAIFLDLCNDEGWYEWTLGDGLTDLLDRLDPETGTQILHVLLSKLRIEDDRGNSAHTWESISKSLDAFTEVGSSTDRQMIVETVKVKVERRDAWNEACNSTPARPSGDYEAKEAAEYERIRQLSTEIDFSDASQIDDLLRRINEDEDLGLGAAYKFRQRLPANCPYDKRLACLGALAETSELDFEDTLDVYVDCFAQWEASSSFLHTESKSLIARLLSAKSTQMYSRQYSSLSRLVYKLRKICRDETFVVAQLLEVIADHQIEMDGCGWLSLAKTLLTSVSPETGNNALEDILSDAALSIADDIGEGKYHDDYLGSDCEQIVTSDIVWHCLGNTDAFVRWSAARTITTYAALGLHDDLSSFFDRFDQKENPALANRDHGFCYENAKQWFLMGLSRACLLKGDQLDWLELHLLSLLKRDDIHAVNKIHILRCLKNIGFQSNSPDQYEALRSNIFEPKHGIIERETSYISTERKTSFSFDYEFEQSEVPMLARLFGLTHSQAYDAIAAQLSNEFPDATSIRDLPGKVRYKRDERYETFPEHIQRHTLFYLASKLVRELPVVRSWGTEENPWKEFLERFDTSYEDGSWLADHKDQTPNVTLENLLHRNEKHQDELLGKDELLSRLELMNPNAAEVPLLANWRSADGVWISLNSGLVTTLGAIKKCSELSKAPAHKFWIPQFGHGGYRDRHLDESEFQELIHVPEDYGYGIDDRDEWATRTVYRRPKLGQTINKVLGLNAVEGGKAWTNSDKDVVLRTYAWGEWVPDTGNRSSSYQDNGYSMYAQKGFMNVELEKHSKSIVSILRVSKYGSRRYGDERDLSAHYVLLRRPFEEPRIWIARNASKN